MEWRNVWKPCIYKVKLKHVKKLEKHCKNKLA